MKQEIDFLLYSMPDRGERTGCGQGRDGLVIPEGDGTALRSGLPSQLRESNEVPSVGNTSPEGIHPEGFCNG